MWLVYLIAVVLGGGALLVQMLGGHDGHDGHPDPDHPGGPGLLSTRSAVYAVFTFGFVGALLHIPRLAEPRTALLVAIASAVVIGIAVGVVFRSLGAAEVSGAGALDEARGRKARVLVSCGAERRGKVRLDVKGQTVDVLATTEETYIAEGAEVVVLDVREGVAHVAAAVPRKGSA